MLTLSRIHDLSRDENPLALLHAVLENGRPLPLTARLRLEHPEVATVVGAALGLRRFLELTYAWSGPAGEMCDRLLELERAGGGFGNAVATAGARAALSQAREAAERAGLDEVADRLRGVIGGCDRVLREAQREGESGLVGDAMDSTLVVWLLCDDVWEERGDGLPGAGGEVGLDMASLWRSLEDVGATHDRVLGSLLEAAVPVMWSHPRAA